MHSTPEQAAAYQVARRLRRYARNALALSKRAKRHDSRLKAEGRAEAYKLAATYVKRIARREVI